MIERCQRFYWSSCATKFTHRSRVTKSKRAQSTHHAVEEEGSQQQIKRRAQAEALGSSRDLDAKTRLAGCCRHHRPPPPMHAALRLSQRRLASTAAAAAVRAGQSQPLPLSVPSSAYPDTVDAKIKPHHLASYTRPPPAAFAAFAHRLNLAQKIPLDKIEQACTHPSVRALVYRFPDLRDVAVNANLATLGNALLGMFATEFVHASYPHLPLRALKAAVSAYVGTPTCANVAKEIGATHLARWHRSVRRPASPPPILFH
jgi:hypothetical protein